jgi:hypothetical protein
MRRGRQAADDGSFARSVGVHTARGAVLIGIAVVLGLVLLQSVDTGRGSGTTEVRTDVAEEVTTTAVPRSTTTTRPTSAVKVLVANGTTTNGVAANAQRAVAQAGYNALAAADATAAAKSARRNTIVYYAAGFDSDARMIANLLGMTPAPPVAPMPAPLPVSDLKGANVLVLIGPDYTARGTATTTAPGATTTTTRNL